MFTVSTINYQYFEQRRFFFHKFISPFKIAFAFLLPLGILFANVQAQTEDIAMEIAPPPLKILSKSEKTQLDAVSDAKDRTKLALELMDVRLLNSEAFLIKEEYKELFDELGSFHALMDNTLNFLDNKNSNSGKVLNNFKRMELSLRKFITRLELIRRELPIKYESYVRSLVKVVREARTRAVEPLFDDSVLPEGKS